MLPSHAVLLFSAAVFAGALNSVAGGGGFIAFPALLFAGIPPINANATNTIALWPGTVAATGAYRRELEGREKWRPIVPLLVVSLIGALVGAHMLLRTSQATFMKVVPWLMLAATLMFTFGGAVTGWMRRRTAEHQHATRAMQLGVIILQLVVAIYIGYFGAGAGILMLALLAITGMENIHTMNGFKTLLASTANGVAVVTFILAKAVAWPQGLLMIFGAVLGGYGGAWFAQKLDPRLIRYLVIAIGAGMSAYFFWRT